MRLANPRKLSVRTRRKEMMVVLLRSIGVHVRRRLPLKSIDGRRPWGFWSRPPHELLEYLDSARACYRAKVKRVHPDKGGNHKDGAELIATWTKIRTRFRQRGIELP